MSRYVVHLIERKTLDEGYLWWGKMVALKNASYYPSPSNAKTAAKKFIASGDYVCTIIDMRKPHERAIRVAVEGRDREVARLD